MPVLCDRIWGVMTTLRMMRAAEKLKIPIYDFRMRSEKGYCVQNVIAVDSSRMENDREYKEVLSEEIGHVVCGALYPLSYCGDRLKYANIQKQERKALNYASRLQVPLCELKNVLAKTQDDYEVAELLDVDIETLRQAVEYYRRNRLLGL